MNPTSFRLSENTLAQLASLAQKHDISPAKLLEHLINDRASASDRAKNAKRRTTARLVFFKDNSDATPAQAFEAGYSAAWLDFQTRHTPDNPIIEPAP